MTKKTTPKAGSKSRAWAALVGRHANGRPQPLIGDTLPVAEVRTIPEVFQVRHPNEADSRGHIADLAAAIKTQGSVDPISIWWSGSEWVCIDGHHRLQAYKDADAQEVRVKVEVGSPQAMLLLASTENKKNRLHMGTAERTEAAWRLTCLPVAERPTKAATVAAAGVGDGQVGKQRRIHRELVEVHDFTEAALQDMTWREALAEHAGRTRGEPGGEAWEEREVEKYQQLLGKTWGTLNHAKVGLFLRALERWDSRLVKLASEEWGLTGKEAEGEHDEGDE